MTDLSKIVNFRQFLMNNLVFVSTKSNFHSKIYLHLYFFCLQIIYIFLSRSIYMHNPEFQNCDQAYTSSCTVPPGCKIHTYNHEKVISSSHDFFSFTNGHFKMKFCLNSYNQCSHLYNFGFFQTTIFHSKKREWNSIIKQNATIFYYSKYTHLRDTRTIEYWITVI